MTQIVGIAGRKQSGKNTTANIIHGCVLKELGMIIDFNIGQEGQLIVLTTNSNNNEGWGEFDINRTDADFKSYAENNMWPYIKLYSFADILKHVCKELFDIPHDQLFGTNEAKDRTVPHLLWENMPIHPSDINTFKVMTNQSAPTMTAREFMQFFGTNIMRRIYDNVWTSNTIKRIKTEQTKLAIICDVRFPNEVECILKEGGSVIKLQRSPFKDSHTSETALDKKCFDQSKFSHVINNSGKCSVDRLVEKIKKLYTANFSLSQ